MNIKTISAACAAMLALTAASCSSKGTAAAEPAEAPVGSLTYSTVPGGEQTAIAAFPIDDEGYTVIFDGANTTGWRGYGKDHIPARWTVADSCLHFAAGEGEGGDIVFAHNYKDFDIQFEWKMSEGGNSGFFYMVQEAYGPDGNLYYSFMSAPEYQLLDNENHPDAKLGVDGNRMSASLYDMIPAKPQNSKPWGEWNAARITVKDGKVTHYQNGEKVVEYTLWTPEWTEMLQNCKFSEKAWPEAFALLNTPHDGFVAFQDHGNDVWIKNVRIKEI